MAKYQNCRWSIQEVEDIYFCTCPYSEFKSEMLEDDSKCNNCTDFFSQIEIENYCNDDEFSEVMDYD